MWLQYTCGLVIATAITDHSKFYLLFPSFKSWFNSPFLSKQGYTLHLSLDETHSNRITRYHNPVYIKERAKEAALYIQTTIILGSGQVLHTLRKEGWKKLRMTYGRTIIHTTIKVWNNWMGLNSFETPIMLLTLLKD